MPFSFNARITDTDDKISTMISSAVNTAVGTLSSKVTALEGEKATLEARVASLEGSTPPATGDATVVDSTVLSLLSSATNRTIAKPANVRAGDLLIMIVAADWGTGAEISPSPGFTQIREHDLGTNYLKVNVAYKVATSSEPSSYEVQTTSSTDTRVDLLVVRGAKNSGPFAVSSVGVISNSNVTSAHSQQVVPNTSRGLLIISAAVSKSQVGQYDFSFTAPPGMTQISNSDTNRWLAMTTVHDQYNSSNEVPSRGFGLATNTTTIDKILVTLVIPSAGS